ncbi:MAG: TetR/AcrR family transcriptional regulator [Actinomycetota bacterium]
MLQKNDTVALILDEARKIVEERGEAGLRVAELADRCGVAVGLLYHYFQDRQAIISAVREDQFVARVEADIADLKGYSTTGNNDDIVDIIVNQFSDPRSEDRMRYRLQRMEVLVAASRDPGLLESLKKVQDRFTSEILATIENAKKSGLVDADVDEKSLALFLEMIPLGATLGIVYGDNLPDPEKWQQFVLRVLSSLMPRND